MMKTKICLVLFFTMVFHLNVCQASSLEKPLSNHERILIDEVLESYFNDCSRSLVTIVPLKGGHSNTCLKLIVNGRSYALRIKGEDTPAKELLREIYAMQEAAKIGIAPKLLYVSTDHKAMLMEFIEGGTTNNHKAKKPENCLKIANAIRKAHSIAKNPFFEEDSNEGVMNVYKEIREFPGFKKNLDEAVELMWNYNTQLLEFESNKVNIHGELNCRNIFLKDKGAIFIDWESTYWEDPFSDLYYFAMRSAYDTQEEFMLLQNYLERPPTSKELERYELNKELIVMDDHSPIRELSYYMDLFSDQQDDDLSLAQYYYDLAKCCLNHAR
jgi:aminoglycoside phosphotransferase (APT) family kinase protein